MAEEGKNVSEIRERALKTLGMMLDYLGLDADLHTEEDGDSLVIQITSENTGRIIGRKGQTLESLRLLLNRIIFRGEEDGPRLVLDVDGYARQGNGRGESGERRRREGGRGAGEDSGSAEERKAVLTQQALDAAKEVKRWGDPITLPKMNSHDRRIIHVTLQDDPEIETNSEGEGAMKKVVVSLKKQ